jgi:hypothetical protein
VPGESSTNTGTGRTSADADDACRATTPGGVAASIAVTTSFAVREHRRGPVRRGTPWARSFTVPTVPPLCSVTAVFRFAGMSFLH